ncbi:alpha/beta fold hydrolase [Corynebacterium poyangense]|uniref:Alpha/beta fold hydrolase n=1 Tax=Corynebacterium poyangense TaxID=2684405 RepID=A0A7H0SL53_9CORY|nr:alpha/beta fold hydrolase [Corynebacterium poyangense]MBZ8177364.1 alpha/beta fold hydrolase [Corynebacterium poyangense]QNQ89278.1 alpha/beta fold hydrolase [Corynebacterium poyangense]
MSSLTLGRRTSRALRRFILAGISALSLGLGISCSAGQAVAGEVTPWTGMGVQLPAKDNLTAAKLAGTGTINPSPSGANEECTPAPGQNPVVLLHGMASNAYESWSAIAPILKAQGRCVYALNYGAYNHLDGQGSSAIGLLPGFSGMDSLDHNLAEVSQQIDLIRQHTGAQKVDLVGWSQGGTLATAYAKEHGSEAVGTVVSIAGVLRGTSLFGLSNLHKELVEAGVPITTAVDGILGPIGNDLLEGSDFMMRLKDGGIEAKGVHYVAISSLMDEAATPLGNSQYNSGDYRNIVLQEGCPGDLAAHLGMPYDPRSLAYVSNALGGNVPVPCTSTVGPFVPGSSL